MTAHERDYLERTIATVRNHRGAENCWPQWANIFADEIERLWSECDRLREQRDNLVARLQADPDAAAVATLDGFTKILADNAPALAALSLIETTAKWYADNPHRLPHEVDHALCVEILDMAQRGLEGDELPDYSEQSA